jgi:hypothetical protein
VPSTPIQKIETEEIKIENQQNLFSTEPSIEKNLVNENFQNNFSNTRILETQNNDSNIDRIVVFYKNGTFKTYSPE